MRAPDTESLACRGLRTHNLKNINVDFELYRWTAVTGVSGSGKSSLVFDTVYAEAQRRFLETLGTYERQFLQGLPQGDFDSIGNVPAAVALKQSNRSSDPRSLVGTAADLFEPLRQMFFSLMDPSCATCGSPVESHSSRELVDFVLKKVSPESNERFVFTVPYSLPKERRLDVAKSLLLEGYFRLVDKGNIVDLEQAVQDKSVEKLSTDTHILLDRISLSDDRDEIQNRMESVWSQVRFSPKFSKIDVGKYNDGAIKPLTTFMVQPFCRSCDKHTTLIQSTDLDWQSVLGACSTCKGLGNIPVLDEAKVIPNDQLSLEEGAIKPWTSETFLWMTEHLIKFCKVNGIRTDIPYAKLDAYTKEWIWTGSDPKEKFKKIRAEVVAIKEFFDVLEAERYKRNSRILLAKYRKYVVCEDCRGARLGKAGRNARSGGSHFHHLMNSEIVDVVKWLKQLKEQPQYSRRIEALQEVFAEVEKKLSLLVKLGLGSSSLARRCKTLSGGEYQRVLLTRVLGNGLTDALYVLDEPSVGLGKTEIPNLIDCLRELRKLGNTILMVEHDPQLIKAADSWIELGPGGGVEGGQVLPKEGPVPKSFKIDAKLPAKAAAEREDVDVQKPLQPGSVRLSGFSMLNCNDLFLEVPLGKVSVITGPSGAGKSTLVQFGLSAAFDAFFEKGVTTNNKNDLDEGIGSWKRFEIPKNFEEEFELVSVKQKAMHRSITSVVSTVLGIMDVMRKLFAASRDARDMGLSASDFSFNGAGACVTCNGRGVIREDLFFLGEVEKTCPDCNGLRYRRDVLDVKLKGKNIAEWLSTNLQDAKELFAGNTSMLYTVHLATSLGLGHLPLGAATSEISGGEAQRLRLCAALSSREKKIFCILDEPTRGLSERDVGNLLATLLSLSSQGHTFVIVEHHETFQEFAHQLIVMGPGAGINGGKIIKREFLC